MDSSFKNDIAPKVKTNAQYDLVVSVAILLFNSLMSSLRTSKA